MCCILVCQMHFFFYIFLILQHIHVQVFHSFVIKYLKCFIFCLWGTEIMYSSTKPSESWFMEYRSRLTVWEITEIISSTWYIFFKSMTVINIDTDNKNSTQSSRMTHRVLCVYAYFKICFHMQC